MIILCGIKEPELKSWEGPLPEICPKCGAETDFGFGLAYGGYGAYVACMNDECDFFAKKFESDE